MHAFDWKTLVNISLWFRTEENMTFSMRCTNGKHRKSLRFPAFTHIKLPRKCVFSAANLGEYVVVYGENANEQKENKLFEVS